MIADDENLKIIDIKGMKIYYYSIYIPGIIEGSIVDIETTALKPSEGVITALGHVKWNKLSAFALHEDSLHRYEQFREWCKDKVSRCNRPLVAYFKRFEQKWLDTKFDIDIQPHAGQAKDTTVENKGRVMAAAIRIDHLGTLTDNSLMPGAHPLVILRHLVQDLYAELALYMSLAHFNRYKKNFLPPHYSPPLSVDDN